jgi:hypothetical protein
MSTNDLLEEDCRPWCPHHRGPSSGPDRRSSRERSRVASASNVEEEVGEVDPRWAPSPNSPLDQASASVQTRRSRRYSKAEKSKLRQSVAMAFEEPEPPELDRLAKAFAVLQRRPVAPSQLRYLIRCYRVHGPATGSILLDLFETRRSTSDLLLALELYPEPVP